MFYGALPGFVYADDGSYASPSITVTFSNNENVSFPFGFAVFDDWINNPNYYANFTSVMQQLGCSACLNSSSSTHFSSDMIYDDFSIPLSISHSGNWQDLSFSLPINYYFVYGSGSEYSYVSLTPYFIGTATITFSDGTTENINLLSATSISFSAKKEMFSNQYVMTSNNFNLSSNPDNGVAISGIPKGEVTDENGNVIDHTVGLFKFAYSSILLDFVKMSSTGVPGAVYVWTLESLLSSGTIVMTSFAIPAANFVMQNAIVQPSLVTLDKSSPNVYITNFSISGSFYFPATTLIPSGSIDFLGDNNFGAFFVFNHLYTYGTSENLLAHIAGTVDDIYFTLRYNIPLAIRHLLIPTQEEVKDVVDGAVDEIKNNAGGLGEAVDIVDKEFKEIQDAISSGSAIPVIFPAFDINIFGYQVKLWEDIDFAPYLDNELTRLVMTPAELMFTYILASLLVRHLYLMWISITSGSSYFGFIRGLNSDL